MSVKYSTMKKILSILMAIVISGAGNFPDQALAQKKQKATRTTNTKSQKMKKSVTQPRPTSRRPPPAQSTRQQSVSRAPIKQTTLTVNCNVRSAAITQDGIILGNPGSSFEVNPGRIVIEVSAPGYQTKRLAVAIQANKPNKINVNLAKLVPKRQQPSKDQLAQIRKKNAGRKASASGGRSASSKSTNNPTLFDDDFAGLDQGPPVSAPAARQMPSRRSNTRTRQGVPRQPSPQYNPSYGDEGYAQQEPYQYDQGQYAQPNARPYQQPYQQPGYGPQYQGYTPPPAYPQYPSYPQYQAPPAYVPQYNNPYNTPYNPSYPSYQAQPSPYYYYPQPVAPPVVAAPIVPPAETVLTPPLSDATLPSVAEAPVQTTQLPEPDELVPRVSVTRKSKRSKPSPLIKFLPFGAGQYQRGNYMLGGLFTVAQGGALALYAINSSNAAAAATNYAKAAAGYNEAYQNNDTDAQDHYESEMTKQKAFGQSSDQNATLCLLGFAAAWAASTIEASINTPSTKSKKSKSKRRRKGLAFETGIGQEGLEAHVSYNF